MGIHRSIILVVMSAPWCLIVAKIAAIGVCLVYLTLGMRCSMHWCLNMKLLTEGTCGIHECDSLWNPFDCVAWNHVALKKANSFLQKCCREKQEIFYIRNVQPGTEVSDFIAANNILGTRTSALKYKCEKLLVSLVWLWCELWLLDEGWNNCNYQILL